MHVRSLCVVCSSWFITNLTKLRYHRCAFTQQKRYPPPSHSFFLPLSLYHSSLPLCLLSFSLSVFLPVLSLCLSQILLFRLLFFLSIAFQIRPLVSLSVALSLCLSQCVSLPLYFSLSVSLPVLSLPACLYLSISVYLFSSWFLCLFLSLCRTLTV